MQADNLKDTLYAHLENCEDADTLRTLVKIADGVIEHLGSELEAAHECFDILMPQLCEAEDDADRYQLLKRMVRDMLVVAAYTGAQRGHAAVEVFKQFDPNTLDESLDALIEAGVLDHIEELEAAHEQAAKEIAREDEVLGYSGAAFNEDLLPQGVLSDEY